jgi:hypothetical protein
MMFESTYRRQAMDRLQEEKPAFKKELMDRAKKEKARTKDPIIFAITAIVAWFTNHT